MTRFARAKGSKASNLKSPEDSTPWEVMKEQLHKSKKEREESKNREEAEKQRIDNYNNFLKEQKTQKRKASWCEFPEAQTDNKKKCTPNESQKQAKNKKKKKLNGSSNVSNSLENIQNAENCDEIHNIKVLKKKNKKKKKSSNIEQIFESLPMEIKQNNHQEDVKICIDHNQDITNETSQKKKKKKNKKQKQSTEEEEEGNTQTSLLINNAANNVNQVEHSNNKKIDRKKKNKNKNKELIETNMNKESNKLENNSEPQERKDSPPSPSKKRKDKKGRRKPVNDKSFQLIINSKEVQLVRFDGFPVMKKDAERLQELKKNMLQKGIPKSEVQRTMKLERRRAEKALARLKRDVCYNCRKGGHNLSDCPDLKSNMPSAGVTEGICFKCGSTEHRQFECKVQRDKEFRFATCFICKEAGHIARQCPDNPKGLYPNGGCCKLCGDVTHLRKDCPTVNEKKESTSIKLQTLTDTIEDIEQNVKQVSEEPVSKKPKKIKF